MVVDDARRWKLRRLADARAGLGRTRLTFLPRREPNTIPATLRAHRHTKRSNGYGHTTNEKTTIHVRTSTIELPRQILRRNRLVRRLCVPEDRHDPPSGSIVV